MTAPARCWGRAADMASCKENLPLSLPCQFCEAPRAVAKAGGIRVICLSPAQLGPRLEMVSQMVLVNIYTGFSISILIHNEKGFVICLPLVVVLFSVENVEFGLYVFVID